MRLGPLHSSARFGTTVQENLTVLIDLDYSALGPTPPDVATASRHLCGLILPGDNLKPPTPDNYYDLAREYYDKFRRNDATGRSALIFLCYFSSFFHELRHVHDLLGSRIGQLLFYNAFNVYQNTPALLNLLWDWQEEHPNERIPIPLARWANTFSGFSEPFRAIFKAWHEASDIFKQMHDLDADSTGDLSIAHLLEASAVNVQMDFVYDVLGNDALFQLHHAIEEAGNAALYVQIRNEMVEAFEAAGYDGVGVGSVLNYLIWIALNQTEHLNAPDSIQSPVRYYEWLAEEIILRIEPGKGLQLEQVRDAVNQLCSDWRIATPDEMRRKTAKHLALRVERMQKAWAQAPGENLANVFQSVVKQYDVLQDLIATMPEIIGQRQYVWAIFYRLLPQVHVKVQMNGTAHDFMSMGTDGVAEDDWNTIATWGGTFRVLADGTGRTYPPFHEDLCFQMLTQDSGDRRKLRFVNPLLH